MVPNPRSLSDSFGSKTLNVCVSLVKIKLSRMVREHVGLTWFERLTSMELLGTSVSFPSC